jgi:hypothetical protein
MITIRKQQTLTLSLKAPIKENRRYLLSWVGLEELRDKLRNIAEDIVNGYQILDVIAKDNKWSTIGMTCSGIRDTSTVRYCPEAAKLAELYKELRQLTFDLIWKHNIDPDFVRREYAVIMDPKQKDFCDNIIRNKHK